MTKPKEKESVGPEIRREWLRRSEEGGETPPAIAKRDGYDVRTVRKALVKAGQEREFREARVLVFRGAIEGHYADLRDFAKQIETEMNESKPIFTMLMRDPLWNSLKQHLPRSPMWRAIDKLEYFDQEIGRIQKPLEQKLQEKVVLTDISNLYGLNSEGIAGAILHRIKILEGSYVPEFKTNLTTEGETQITFGPFPLAVVRDKSVSTTINLISELMAGAVASLASQTIRELLEEKRKAVKTIKEELVVIRLQRIVKGRCRYCPT